MTDRDQFAAAALTGLLSDEANQWPTALQWEHLLKQAYRWADAMLSARERTDLDAAPAAKAPTDASPLRSSQGVTAGMGTGESASGMFRRHEESMAAWQREFAVWRNETASHDAAPAAKAQLPTGVHASEGGGGDGTDKPVTRTAAGTGNQTAPPCVETDGSSPAIAQPPASSDGSGEGRPLDGTRPDTKGEATGGRGHNTQEPVAWMVKENAEFCAAQFLFTDEERAKKFAKIQDGLTVVPLYRQQQTCPYVVGRTTLHCSLTPLSHKERAELQSEIASLRLAIRRLADQDATLSVCDGNVTVTMDATLTDEEREAIRRAIFRCTVNARARRLSGMDELADEDRKDAETFGGLLKRIG